MTTNNINDADLVRYLDGELNAEARSAVDARLAAEPASIARLEALRRRSQRLSQLLLEVDPAELNVRRSASNIRPVLERPARGALQVTWMKAAAAIAVLLGLGFAVPPVRAWVVERVLEVAALLGRDNDAARTQPPAPAETTSEPDAPLTVHIPISSDTFRVHLAGPLGQLIVLRHTLPGASAEPSAGASMVALSNAIRLERGSTTNALFTLRLPLRVTILRIVPDSGASTDYVLPVSGQELRIDLGR